MNTWSQEPGQLNMSMINVVWRKLKPAILMLLIVGLLQLTGLWSGVSATTLQLVMKTGLLNADTDVVTTTADFDYDFTIKDLNGQQVAFEKYKGKVLFVNLWATWCGPCKAEMPGIQSLKERLNGQPVEFVMLSVDKEAALPKVKSYVDKNQFTFPVFMTNGYVPDILQVPSIPTTFVISKDGKVLMREVGTRNYNTNKMVNFLIKQTSK